MSEPEKPANGGWLSLLNKVVLVAFVPLLGWCIWMTSNQFRDNSFRERGDRFTSLQAEKMKLSFAVQMHEERQRTDDKFSLLPPITWQNRILSLETNQTLMRQDQIKMLTIQQAILDRIDAMIEHP